MKILLRGFTLVLVAIVLVSSTSFIVGMHFCSKEIQNVALFSQADGCEKEKELPACHRHVTPACCDDETFLHMAKSFSGNLKQIKVLLVFDFVNLHHQTVSIAKIISFTHILQQCWDHDPPLMSTDWVIVLRVFLI